MRLLYIGWANHVHLARWAEYFAARGHRVWILPMISGAVSGCTTLPFLTRRMRAGFQTAELRFYMRVLAIDLVHVHWAGFGVIPCRAGIRRYVVTAYGSDIYQLAARDAASRTEIAHALRASILVTVDSEDLRRTIVDLGVPQERIQVIQWGVDTALFHPGVDGSELRRRIGIGESRVIYSPRNIRSVYNVDVVLDAFKLILQSHPETLLIQKHYLCDSGEIESYLKRASERGVRERIRLVGDMPYKDLPALYSIADVLVSIPSSDATPMSVLEGMACGVLPVVSDVPSLREWIVNGENGYIVPIKDPVATAAAIGRVLSGGDAAQAAGMRNRDLVVRRADHRISMRSMERHYSALLER